MKRGAITLLAVAGSVLAVAGPVSALEGDPPANADIACGATISESITLTHDLTCAGDALLVTSPSQDIVIDLGGHTVRGGGGGTGILVRGGTAVRRAVTVQHGTIANFGRGVSFDSVLATARDLTVRSGGGAPGTGFLAAAAGVQLFGAPDARLTGLRIVGFPVGVQVQSSDGAVLADSTLRDNVTGVTLVPTVRQFTIERSTLSGSVRGVRASQSSVTIKDSTVRANKVGIELFQSTGVIAGSRILDNTTGLTVDSNGSGIDLTASTIEGNSVGVWLGTGQLVDNFRILRISGNTIADNKATGLLLHAARPVPLFDATGPFTIEGNRITGNGKSPAAAVGLTNHGLPMPAGAADDGAHLAVQETSTIPVLGNVANNNGDWGIFATGVVDGGGNQGRRNGQRGQCSGVTC